MKFSKYNNPHKKNVHKASGHSKAWTEAQKEQMWQLIAESPENKDAIIKAFKETIR